MQNINEVESSYGVAASVPGPTNVRAKKLPGSQDQGDDEYPMQGSSAGLKAKAGKVEDQVQSRSSGENAESHITQGSSKIKQPPQVTAEDIDVIDDVEAIFEGAELTEDFKNKALVIFESAVVSKINEKLEEITEEMQSELEDIKTSLAEELTEKLDSYLDYVVEQWMEENQLAVEVGLKSEITENFLQGLRSLFVEHYVDIPEEKVDVVENLATHVADLEESLNVEMTKNVELNTRVNGFEREIAFANMIEGLTDTQVAKLESLSESISFSDIGEFKSRVKTLRENYFPSALKVDLNGQSLDEDPVDLVEETVVGDPSMRSYVTAIARTIKK